MRDKTHCPHCGVSLQGKEIPQELRDRGYYGAKATHFGREIGVEILGGYDGALYLQCPDCAGTWQRWPEGHPLYEAAAPYIHGSVAR